MGGEGEGAARVRWRHAALFRALILLRTSAATSHEIGLCPHGIGMVGGWR